MDCPVQLEVKEMKVCLSLPIAFAVAMFFAACPAARGGSCQPHWDVSLGQPGADGWLYWLARLPDPGTNQPTLYAGGLFTSIGGVPAVGIAKWDGTNWHAMGDGLNSRVFAIEIFDDGTGPAVYAGGDFTMSGSTPIASIARLNQKTQRWEQVGAGLDGAVIALSVWDDGMGGGPALWAGGIFMSTGGVSARRVARWNGTNWSSVAGGMDDGVRSFCVYDDGTGPHLYAGGLFNTAGGTPASRIAKWTGTNWVALGLGLSAPTVQGIRTMAVYDDGGGPALYVGGNFQGAGGQPANNVARWKDNAWSALGNGVNERLVNMTTFDDGSGAGEKLYCGGWFTAAGGSPVSYVATWNGQSWAPLGAGTNTVVRAFAPWTPQATARRLFVGGGFTQAAGQTALHIAAWEGCPDPVDVPGDINGDGNVNVQDLLGVINSWGACPADPAPCPADIAPPPAGDGTVNVSDLLMVIANWG
jgi:hypothetical protein